MDSCDNVRGEDDLMIPIIPDEALERAAGTIDSPAWTINYCTYNYYQCGPIGDRAA